MPDNVGTNNGEPTEPKPEDDGTQPPEGAQSEPEPKPQAKPNSLEELLADLDEERRNVILEQVRKPRQEAKGLRDRLNELEPKATELDQIKEAQKSEADRLAEQYAAKDERIASLENRLVVSAVEGALAGVPNAEGIIEDLNLDRFRGDDGLPDATKIEALREKYSALIPAEETPRRMQPNPAQGQSGQAPLTPAQSAAERESQGDWKGAVAVKAAQMMDLHKNQ